MEGVNACNFSIGSQIDLYGNILGNIIFNPPVLGESIQKIGNIQINFLNSSSSRYVPLSSLRLGEHDLSWPTPYMKYPEIGLTAYLWAPIEKNNIFITSFPILFADFYFEQNNSIQFIPNLNPYQGSSIHTLVSINNSPYMPFSGALSHTGISISYAIIIWHPNLYICGDFSSHSSSIDSFLTTSNIFGQISSHSELIDHINSGKVSRLRI